VLKEVVARVDGLNDIVEDLLVFARQRELRLSRLQVQPLLGERRGVVEAGRIDERGPGRC
jgi:hypothetical protein